MKNFLFFGPILLALSGPLYGQAAFFSYAEWAASDQATREAYIAGAFDSYIIVIMGVGSVTQKATAEYYLSCFKSARFTDKDLADRVRAYAEARPPLQRASVIGALIDYLAALCGKP